MPVEAKDIIDHAERLGKLVADHPAVQKYRDAQKSVGDDPDARAALSDFNRMIESLARQEQQGMSITDAQRLSLESLQTRVASNLKVKALNIAQVDFMDLLRKVSEAWQKPLSTVMGIPGGEGAKGGDSARGGPRIVGG